MKGEYPRFKDIYSREALIEHFHLTESERALINDLRGSANRLGAAILLKSLLYLGYFPHGFNKVPGSVRAYIAEQLQVPNSIAKYSWNSGTRDDHISLIRSGLFYLDLEQPPILELEAV